MKKIKPETGITTAVKLAGSQGKLAMLLGVKQQSVFNWKLKGYVPILRAQEIEALLGVPRKTLINPKVAGLLASWSDKL